MTQQEAFTILKESSNVFLTGQPGAGKTYLTNQYIDWLLDTGLDFAVTASTGIAALNIGGRTLHSFAGLRDDKPLTQVDVEDILGNTGTYRRYNSTKVLIVDEVSMVSAQLLENVDMLAKTARKSNKPFGGMKLVVVGDFFQLPPVKGEFAFTSPVWQEADFTICNLTEQHRTEDAVFIDILNGVRAGVLTNDQKNIIRSRVVDDVSALDGVIRLDTHNKKVDEINDMKLKRLTTPPKTYKMSQDGDEKYIDGLKKSCLSPEMLVLKVGARIIFTKNDIEQRYVNGTQGEVIKLNEDGVTVRVYSNDLEVQVTPSSWQHSLGYGKNKKVLASIYQLPVRLAWAITIHKSQGMTLDKAIIDVSRVFENGQAYVAVSRVRSLDGVHFQGKLTKGFLNVSDKVKEFYANNT